MPSSKEQFLDTHKRECETTLKVLRAYPADKQDFKPHERSQTAKVLVHTLGVEQGVTMAAVNGTLDMSGGFPPAPATIGEAITAFEKESQALRDLVAKTPDSRLGQSVKFFTGPKQVGDVPIEGLMWMMLMDQVHHRGQLSVYLRMAGGKVPSIYGPSADEPWS